MPELITKTQFARRAGVTPTAISKALRTGLLKPGALVGGKVDAQSPAAKEYLAFRAKQKVRPGPPRKREQDAAEMAHLSEEYVPSAEIPSAVTAEVVRQYGHMTLHEIVIRFGSIEAFNEHLKAVKALVSIEAAQLANDKARGDVIPRSLVTRLVGLVSAAMSKLLSEAPITAAAKVYEAVRAGAHLQEVEAIIRDQISHVISAVKSDMQKGLASAT